MAATIRTGVSRIVVGVACEIVLLGVQRNNFGTCGCSEPRTIHPLDYQMREFRIRDGLWSRRLDFPNQESPKGKFPCSIAATSSLPPSPHPPYFASAPAQLTPPPH